MRMLDEHSSYRVIKVLLHPDYVFICDFHYGNSFKFFFLGFNFQAFVCDKKSKKQVVIIVYQGVKLTFFSDSHLVPKFFKVVANSRKVGRHFQRQTKSFFTLSACQIDPPKLTCYKVDTRMDDIQRSGSSKSKMVSSYRSRCMCLETNLTRKFAADLSLQIFLIHYISW